MRETSGAPRAGARAFIALANASRRSSFALVRHQVLRAQPIAGEPVVTPIATQ
jgi:hypothetical protein